MMCRWWRSSEAGLPAAAWCGRHSGSRACAAGFQPLRLIVFDSVSAFAVALPSQRKSCTASFPACCLFLDLAVDERIETVRQPATSWSSVKTVGSHVFPTIKCPGAG